MANLDRIAAQHAQQIIENTKQFIDDKGQAKPLSKDEVENVLTKTLGVCQEQGVYAGVLYLLSRSNQAERAIAKQVKQQLVAVLGEPELAAFGLAYQPTNDDGDNAHPLLDHFATQVCGAPVQTVLFVKDLFERTLTYARYSAKARQS